MTTNTHNGRWSHRLGRGAGRAWRGYLRREQRVAVWLVTRGVPAGAATAVLWIVKLAVLGMLLYTVSWLVLLLAFAVIAAWLARNADEDDEKGRAPHRGAPAPANCAPICASSASA